MKDIVTDTVIVIVTYPLQASIIEQKTESIFYEKPVSDVIIFQDDKKRFFCLNALQSGKRHGHQGNHHRHGKRASKRSSSTTSCRFCEKSELELPDFEFRRKGSKTQTTRSQSAKTISNSSSRTLSTNLSMENNVADVADVLTKNVTARRASEPLSIKVDEKELKESKVLSSSFGDQGPML